MKLFYVSPILLGEVLHQRNTVFSFITTLYEKNISKVATLIPCDF